MLASDTSHFDENDLRARQIQLFSAGGYCSSAVAELSVAMMILLLRQYQLCASSLGSRAELGHELASRAMGIIGAGRIGIEVGRIATALQMCVQYSERFGQGPSRERENVTALIERSDVLSINLPLTNETRGLLNRELLQRIKPHAVILCPSPPEVFDIEAILQMAKEKYLSIWFDGVSNHPCWQKLTEIPTVVVTSSLGARSFEAQNRLLRSTIDNIEFALSSAVIRLATNH